MPEECLGLPPALVCCCQPVMLYKAPEQFDMVDIARVTIWCFCFSGNHCKVVAALHDNGLISARHSPSIPQVSWRTLAKKAVISIQSFGYLVFSSCLHSGRGLIPDSRLRGKGSKIGSTGSITVIHKEGWMVSCRSAVSASSHWKMETGMRALWELFTTHLERGAAPAAFIQQWRHSGVAGTRRCICRSMEGGTRQIYGTSHLVVRVWWLQGSVNITHHFLNTTPSIMSN
jgi:hypothetical protein